MKQSKNLFSIFQLFFLLMKYIDSINLSKIVFYLIIENGTIILIGATTENSSFSLNDALLPD